MKLKGREQMERIFQILAVILAGIAAFLLWQGNGDGAFVAAVLGSVAFFLSVRFQVKGRLKDREEEEEEAEKRRQGEAENSESPLLPDKWQTENFISNEQRATENEQKANL